MRIGILLSSVFAASLLTTAAFADHSEDKQDRAHFRASSAKEVVVREARTREASEARARMQRQTKEVTPKSAEHKAPASLAEKRGCTTDDGGSCSSSKHQTSSKTTAATNKTKVPAAAMPAKAQQKGCATDDGNGCAASSKSDSKAKDASKSTTGVSDYMVSSKPKSASVAEQILKMRREVDAKFILDLLKIKSCTRNGSCGDVPD